MLITWYARQGVNNPFAVVRSIRVYGDVGGSGYAVAALAAEFKKEAAAVGEVTVSGWALGGLPAESGGADWRAVYPFADSVKAVLLTYGGMTALICDTAVYAPSRDSATAVAPQFHEKLDILTVPPSTKEDLLNLRNRFRPRFVAVAVACADSQTHGPAPNILCAAVGENGRFGHNFSLRNGKAVF